MLRFGGVGIAGFGFAPVPAPPTGGPTFVSAATNSAGTQTTITMSTALDTGSVSATSAFVISVATVSAVNVVGSTVVLTHGTIYSDEERAVTVTYTPPGSNKLRDVGLNNAAAFTGPITNVGTTPKPLDGELQVCVDEGLLEFWYDPSYASPLVNRGCFNGTGDDLADTGGTCPITADVFGTGNSAYEPETTGGYLRTGVLTEANGRTGLHTPGFIFEVCKWRGSPSINLVGHGAATSIVYQDADQISLQLGSNLQSAAGRNPLAPMLVEAYCHAELSRFGVHGGFVTGTTSLPGSGKIVDYRGVGRISVGASTTGTLRSAYSCGLRLIFNNRIPYARYLRIHAKICARFGLTGVATHASYVQPEDDLKLLAGFPSNAIILPMEMQSLASNYGVTAGGNQWGAGTYILTNKGDIIAGADPADDETRQLDSVSIDAVANTAGVAGSLAKMLAARYSRPVVVVPNALTATSAKNWARPGHDRRGWLWGSALYRNRLAIFNGGTLKFKVIYQMETEAQSGVQADRDGWASIQAQHMADERAKLVIPDLWFIWHLPRAKGASDTAGWADARVKMTGLTSLDNQCSVFGTAAPSGADPIHPDNASGSGGADDFAVFASELSSHLDALAALYPSRGF